LNKLPTEVIKNVSSAEEEKKPFTLEQDEDHVQTDYIKTD
jgi:hypothetical protein